MPSITVNLAEVMSRFARDGHDPREVLRRITGTPIEIVAFDSAMAAITAILAPITRRHGLSLGDRACLALALARGIPAMTANRIWARLKVDVEVRVIR